ncbi:hypothetical protein FBUS_03831 [Fasciolopsis buskii]|uniref:Uncharacterized protein n=1 Tax=Fasciolopsis buskii TaxID=27845 RepID=A0A8E0S3U5_9TREM|nr:hypothetical protein FBUS_03831 [Fasciolopsis buski]
MPAIGIDLGTTYSCVAYLDDDEVNFVPDSGERLIPSCVMFNDDQILVGSSACLAMETRPESTIYHFKRMIACDFANPAVQSKRDLWPYEIVRDKGKPKFLVKLCDAKEVWSPEDLTGILLKHLKDLSETHLRENINQAVITVPAMFSMAQREATRTAAEQAGFDVLGLLNEPTAAAIAFGMNLSHEDHITLVFDLGGGTCDVTIFHYFNKELTVKATCGDVHLGGEDFDQSLVEYCVNEILIKYNTDIRKDKICMLRLRKDCEHAKKQLDTLETTVIKVTYSAQTIPWTVVIDRKTFEDMNLDKFERAIQLIAQCLKDAKLSRDSITSVLLVGGASRMPRIQVLLSNYFGNARINKSMHEGESVAYGAAIWAAYLSGRAETVEKYIGKFRDVTPLAFGIESNNGEMYVIFPKNTHVPQSKTLRIVGEQCVGLRIRMYEGENKLAMDNHFLGEAQVTAPPLCDTPLLEITFCLDKDGNISLYSTDRTSNKRTDLVIHGVQGRLYRQDLDYLIRNPQTNPKQDHEENQRVAERDKIKLEIQRLLHQAKVSTHLRPPDMKTIEKSCHSALQWIKNFPNESISAYRSVRFKLQTIVSRFQLKNIT